MCAIRGANSSSATTMTNADNNAEWLRVYSGIQQYCATYNIPRENLLDILEDQKVLPMIRGKATEFIATAVLRQVLDSRDWVVTKLNLNAQTSQQDRDINLTFRRTGTQLNAEAKNAVRGSFRLQGRKRPQPFFTVKCHKSRSNLKLQSTTNDRYLVGEFDLLLCNVSNAIFVGKSLDAGLHLISDKAALDWLRSFYDVSTDDELIRAAYDDWRLCLPVSIADEAGVIPRQPVVYMEDDANWFGPERLAPNLRSLLNGVGT